MAIPRLYGTVRLLTSAAPDVLHPAVDFVNGLAMSHPGPSVNKPQIGRDLTKERPEEVSQRVLDFVRMIRHRPVLVDFGAAMVDSANESVSFTPCGSGEVRETRETLADLRVAYFFALEST
ncbi:hypothetical protein B0H17DRAFT_1208261 [Mycena rosella]|uniref:Uncharacterized protein n=1 Tax=Mycena rosella TaxID=1033263 RepID=A0AAD7G7C2_MYCRO|nr:hypothetical protein B0H17DRAFT_1208261 [Mycena rosella]